MWLALASLCIGADPVLADLAMRAGSIGFDDLRAFEPTRDGSLLVAGERWGAFDFGARSLPELVATGAPPPRMMRWSGGYLARVDLDGSVRFLAGTSLGADLWGAAELRDGRVFVAGMVRERTATFGRLELPARGDHLVGFAAFVSAQGEPERAVMIGSAGDVWVRDVAAVGAGAVVVGAFDGRIEAPRPLHIVRKESEANSDGFILKIGADGAIGWSARVGTSTFTDEVQRAETLADGTLVVTGTVAHQVVFEDGQGRTTSQRCGDPVVCPFIWGLDPETGATRFSNVLRNGSGYPDAAVLVALADGGFVVGGGMGRNLRVGSAVERKKKDEAKLRAPAPVGSSWLARFTRDGSLAWARRIDDGGSQLEAAAPDGAHLWLAGSGDLGAEPGQKAPRAGEGPATLARVRLADGAFVDALSFGRPVDAPVTKSDGNLRVTRMIATRDGRIALAGRIEERAWLHLAQGPVELKSRGAESEGFANENDLFVSLLKDPHVLASTALPPTTTARQDPFEGCVARRAGTLLVPCEPRARSGERSIHHSCIEGMRREGDRRIWSCGPVDDEVPLTVGEQQLFFLERAARGQLALYREMVGTGRCGGLDRMACRVTARLLDGDGGVVWSHALDAALNGATDTDIAEVRLVNDTLYVVEGCWGYELGHRGRCDQLVALDAATGRVRWRSDPLTVHGSFATADDLIVGFSHGTHGTSKSRRHRARLVAIDRATGKLVAEVPVSNAQRVEEVSDDRVRLAEGPFNETPTLVDVDIVRERGRVRLVRRTAR